MLMPLLIRPPESALLNSFYILLKSINIMSFSKSFNISFWEYIAGMRLQNGECGNDDADGVDKMKILTHFGYSCNLVHMVRVSAVVVMMMMMMMMLTLRGHFCTHGRCECSSHYSTHYYLFCCSCSSGFNSVIFYSILVSGHDHGI